MKMPVNRISQVLRPVLAAVFVLAALVLSSPRAAAAQEHGQPAAQGATGHAAETAAAHGDAGHGPKAGVLPTVEEGIVPAIVSLIVFSLVFAILATQVWPRISRGLEERANKIRDEIASAESSRKQAKEALEQYEKSLADARAEAHRMLEKTKAEQQAMAEELKAKAAAELGAMKDRARQDIESAKAAALAEIYEKAANAATAIAGKILQREVNARDQQRLIQEALGELEVARN